MYFHAYSNPFIGCRLFRRPLENREHMGAKIDDSYDPSKNLCATHRRLRRVPVGSRRLEDTPGGSRRLHAARGYRRRLQEAPGGSRIVLEAAGGSMRPEGAPGGSRRLQEASGGGFGRLQRSKRLQEARGCSRSHGWSFSDHFLAMVGPISKCSLLVYTCPMF